MDSYKSRHFLLLTVAIHLLPFSLITRPSPSPLPSGRRPKPVKGLKNKTARKCGKPHPVKYSPQQEELVGAIVQRGKCHRDLTVWILKEERCSLFRDRVRDIESYTLIWVDL